MKDNRENAKMKLDVWLENAYKRIFHDAAPRKTTILNLEGALNDRFNFQVATRLEAVDQSLPAEVWSSAKAPSGWNVRIRRVGHVPVAHGNTTMPEDPAHNDGLNHIPGFVPDPLFDSDTLRMPPRETNSFWITVTPPKNAQTGKHWLEIEVKAEYAKRELRAENVSVELTLYDIKLKKRENFNVTHWFYIDALLDWYQLADMDRRFWKILGAYMRNMADHGQNVIYVPVFTPSLDGVKRPSQLLKVKKTGRDNYSFDWSNVRKYVNLAKRSGLDRFEWSHLFTQWGANYAIRIYEGNHGKLLWSPELPADSPKYIKFLKRYLVELHDFLRKENILAKSFFHLSDEPQGDETKTQYAKLRGILNEIAPWMKIMDALSDMDFAKERLVDHPVPSIKEVSSFLNEGIECWCYYCCSPRDRYLNHLMDTPLAKIAMHGFLFHKLPLNGFLHWGYNYWYKSQTRDLIDPFTTLDGTWFEKGWAFGDPFLVYPGPQGPIDSIRWEVFSESMRDYQLLQTLNIPKNDELLKEVKNFKEFPTDIDWRLNIRSTLLKSAVKSKINDKS